MLLQALKGRSGRVGPFMSGGDGTAGEATILSCANHLKGVTRDTPNGIWLQKESN